MRWRHISCALIMFFASIGLSRADVTYSYVAGSPGEAIGTTANTTGGTAVYTGVTGSVVSVPLYLLETVTPTASSPGNATSSIINSYIYASAFDNFFGVGGIGAGFAQTGLSAGGTNSQIGGGTIWTPAGSANGNHLNGVMNNAGFTFGPGWSGSFTVPGQGTVQGGGDLASLYMNLNNPNGFNGNNLQVATGLESAAENGNNNTVTQGPLTNGATLTNAGKQYVGTGVVLIGTVNVTVGTGTTTFQLTGLSSSTLVAPTDPNFNPKFDTFTLSSISSTKFPAGFYSGATTSASGVNSDTVLGNATTNNKTSSIVSLDTTYNALSTQRSTTTAYDTFISIAAQAANPNSPVTGPDATPPSASFLPYFTASPTAFTVTVGTATVPEPSSMALCGLLTMGGAWFASKRRRKIAA